MLHIDGQNKQNQNNMDKSNGKNEFDSTEFEKRLTNLKDTQDSIQAMSAWCLQHRSFHKKVVTSWLTVLKQVKVEHRLTLFYLANDVIQYSKRKNYEFVDSWGTALQRATTMVRDEKVKQKIERIFRIWEQRGIYNEEFLSDLHDLLSINPAKKPQPNENDDEQATITVSNIRNCMRLEKETDKCFKLLSKTPLCDTDTLHLLKDRSHVEEVEREMNENRAKLELYVKALSGEIKARSILIAVLDQADAFYHNQRGEVKVVANAYRNFGNRIKMMKKRLDELMKTLPSPIPSPDINAPSPGPADDDFVLPGEKDFDTDIFDKQPNGLMGYMDSSSLPFDISDFDSASPKSTDTQHMHSLMMDTYTAVPQPVPPVVPTSLNTSTNSPAPSYMNYSGIYSQPSATPFDQYNQSMQQPPPYMASVRPVPPPNIFQPGNLYNQSQSQNPYASANSFINSMPQPPPMPPTFNNRNADVNDEYNPDSWEIDMSWNTTQDSSFNQSLDGPHSPPHYERKATANAIEYIDPSVDDSHMAGAGDVDHRQLILPNVNGLSAIGAKDRGRLVDVDHRNLISLTGSPKLNEKDVTSQSPAKDMDLRHMNKSIDSSNPVESLQSPSSSHVESKLVPPPSPPAMLLAQSAGVNASDTVNAMNPPLLPPPRFQSPPLSKLKHGKLQNRSPAKGQNGRDNNESIDMEMSDEDFDAMPESQNTKSPDPNTSGHTHESQDGLHRPPRNLFGSPPPSFNKNSSLDSDGFDGPPFDNMAGDMSNRTPNPFSNNSNSHEMLHRLQHPPLMMHQTPHMNVGRAPRPLLEIPTGFNSNARPFMHHGQNSMDMDRPPMAGNHNPFMMNSPRTPSGPFLAQSSPMNNFRGAGPPSMMRNTTPYNRNQRGNMRGGFRGGNSFRGGNMRGNW